MQLIWYIQLSRFAFNFLLRNLIIKTAPPSVPLLIITDPEWTLSTEAANSLYALRLQLTYRPPALGQPQFNLCGIMYPNAQSSIHNPHWAPCLRARSPTHTASCLASAHLLCLLIIVLTVPPPPSVCCFFFFVFVNKLPGRLNSNYAHILRAATET